MAYVTLDEVKGHLSLTGSTHNAVLTPLIDAAVAGIEEETEQVWESPASAAKYFVVEHGWHPLLDIPRAQTISEVAEKRDGSWEVLDADDWEAVETDKATEQLVRLNGCWQWTLRGEASVRVTGVFATTATAPADIKTAVILLVARLFQRRQAPLGFTSGGIETAVMEIMRVDPDIRALLRAHRDIAVG